MGKPRTQCPLSYDVTVTADNGYATVADTFSVLVRNVAPTITSTSGVPAMHDLSFALAVDADFTDPGTLDTHTAVFSWDDGTTTPTPSSRGGGWIKTPGRELSPTARRQRHVIATDERLATSSLDRFWIAVRNPAGSVVFAGSTLPAGGAPIVGKGIQVHQK